MSESFALLLAVAIVQFILIVKLLIVSLKDKKNFKLLLEIERENYEARNRETILDASNIIEKEQLRFDTVVKNLNKEKQIS